MPLFLVLAFVAYLTVQFAVNEREDQGSILRTYQVMDQIRQIMADVQDAEAGQRGYLITRDPAFLAPFKVNQAKLNRDLAIFRTLTADNPVQQERAGQLAELTRDRLNALQRGLVFAFSPGAAPPELQAVMAQGKQAMNKVRTEIAAGIGEEQRLLQSRIRSRHQAEANVINTAFAAAAVALLLLIVAALVLVRNNVRLARTENERTRQRNILQATLDNIRDGVGVFDSRGKLVAFNETFFRFLDFPEELRRLETPLETFQAIDRGRDNPVFEEWPTATGEPEEGYQQVTLDGRVLDVYRNTVPGGGFLVAAMDVTARMRAEQAVRQAQKMEAIGHLTGGVAHDFNNLLQIVSANLDLLVADLGDNPRSAQRLHNAIGAVERGARLTAQLLAFARRQTLNPRTINLGRLIPGMTDLLRRTLGERIQVEAVVAEGLWNTSVDANQLENALLNLAINSRDAMPDGGKLTIEVANAILDESYAAQHGDISPGQYVMIAVTDTGQGIPEKIVQRVFDPFFTTKPEGQGTGLGLSQVYGFVNQSGGHVKIESEEGRGTTIKVYLPRTRKAEDDFERAPRTPVVGGTETILVVEDDDGVRAAVVDLLGELKYHVLKARNAEEALEILRSGQKIDLLFTDIVMPGPIPTRELARRAQEIRPGIVVLFTSGYTQDAIARDGKLDDEVFLLSKPYRRDDLARKLRSLLDRPVRNVSGEAAAVEASATEPAETLAKPRRALVVEDVALIRMTTVDMMQELGFETVEAATAAEALDFLKADLSIGVLLTDLGLPGMRGDVLANEALLVNPRLKIVIASGYSPDTASVPPGTTFLQKPFDATQLGRALGIA